MIDTAKVRYPRMKKYEHKIKQAQFGVNKAKWGWFDGLTFSYTYKTIKQANECFQKLIEIQQEKLHYQF